MTRKKLELKTDMDVTGTLTANTDAIASGTQAEAIDDIATDANGTAIATAVNSIIAALVEFGIVAASE